MTRHGQSFGSLTQLQAVLAQTFDIVGADLFSIITALGQQTRNTSHSLGP